MDVSQEYIKMCESAEEIQKKHIPTHDNYYYYGDFRGMAVRSIDERDKIIMEIAKTSTWLPTQAQLQKMVKGILTDTPFHNVTEFYFRTHREAKNYRYYCLHFMSMEQLWLAFVMKEQHNKTWNGEEWLKEKKAKK